MTSYATKIMLYAPSLLWPLNSATGANDLSGNSRNGTGAGGITIGGSASSPIDGETNSTDFAGDNDSVTSAWNPWSGSITLTGWAYRDTSSGGDYLISAYAVGAGPPGLSLASGNQNVVWASGDGSGAITWTNAWPGNTQWVHWALVFEPTSSVSLYINGSLVSTQATAGTYHATPGNFLIGRQGAGFNYFDGKMAYVAVFSHALVDTEIRRIYEFGLYGKAMTPVAWHPRQFA